VLLLGFYDASKEEIKGLRLTHKKRTCWYYNHPIQQMAVVEIENTGFCPCLSDTEEKEGRDKKIISANRLNKW
jgi:hypothetical protein